MGKLQYSLMIAFGVGLITQTVQQFDDDHFPHPDTHHGPKRQVQKDDHFPNPNNPWPEVDDVQKKLYTDVPPPAINDNFPINQPPIDQQVGNNDQFPHIPNWPDNDGDLYSNLPPNIVPQFDNGHLPNDHRFNNDDQNKPLPSEMKRQFGDNDNLPDNHINHQIGNDDTPHSDNGLKRQISWPDNDIRNKHYPTVTPPRIRRHIENLPEFHGDPVPSLVPPIDRPSGNNEHPLNNGLKSIEIDFPNPNHPFPEIDDHQKRHVSRFAPPIDHQIDNNGHPLPDVGLKRKDIDFPEIDDHQIGKEKHSSDNGPKSKDIDFPNPNYPFPEIDDHQTGNNVPPANIPPVDHQLDGNRFLHPDTRSGRKKRDIDFPQKDNVFPTHIPPIPTYVPPISHQFDDDHFPHPDTRTGPKKRDGQFPDSDDLRPEIDDSQKRHVPAEVPIANHQLSEDHLSDSNNNIKKEDVDFPSPDDFDRRVDNGNDVKENSVVDTTAPKINRATCFGINGGKNCRKTCQQLKESDSGRCYCTGSCEWSTLILTCKCKNPTCSC